MKKWVGLCGGGVFGLICVIGFEFSYPDSYGNIKVGMSESEVRNAVVQDGFILVPQFGRFNGVWVKRKILGEWIIKCDYKNDRVWHAAAWLHMPWGGEYIRARSKNLMQNSGNQ